MDDVQIIKQDGKPAFAVVPYDVWISMTAKQHKNTSVPIGVIALKDKHNCSLIAAWRRYKGLSQSALAKQIGVGQSALSQMEKVGNQVQSDTLKKIAQALELDVEQLQDYGL
ncbi:helix-turn-helix domain-containing protein [Pseudoalteromonas umbrosa]|uniref:helix-turn-helix domain-containing protein n=1 Tax=Pseudoalteromonas umbrosa TaxID=3048489 RepID=UPI0024C30094|nr:helix-turn-helix transcriptional regulator [Pseudoalteromonas sp. B95]MDK1290219.1 helix-turn-helix transcriptional regulator [Pseudoalteromonas sp. B95]